MSYNIMDSGFADESGKYDPVGDRIPGNLTNFMAQTSPFVDVLGIVETGAWSEHGDGAWSEHGGGGHPGYLEIAKSWGYEYVHVRGNCAIMSHANLTIVDEPSVGSSTIVARAREVTFIVTSMSAISSARKYVAFEDMAEYVMKHYKDEPTVLMGDLNSVSPQDRHRYNETLLCGNGTYDAAAQSGEYLENYCLAQAPPLPPNGTYKGPWVETTGINWCSGVDCLIDNTGQCGEKQADLFGAGTDNNAVLLPTSMSTAEQVAACEGACANASECLGFTYYPNRTVPSSGGGGGGGGVAHDKGVDECCFRSDTHRKPANASSTARCYEKKDYTSKWALDFKPMESLLNQSDLIDLCYIGGGFYDIDTDNRHYPYSQCGFSNPTLLIHMTGHYSDKYAGSRAHDHATAKIDYILANAKMLETHRFHHTSVVTTFQADGCSDHYPIEATFMS